MPVATSRPIMMKIDHTTINYHTINMTWNDSKFTSDQDYQLFICDPPYYHKSREGEDVNHITTTLVVLTDSSATIGNRLAYLIR